MSFSFGTLCSGIEAPAIAFADVGARQLFAAEIDAFCCAVLAIRQGATAPWDLPEKYPERERNRMRRFAHWGEALPNFGDIHQIDTAQLPAVDLLVSGTPCQDFSAAGRKAGLNGPNGKLTLRFLDIVDDLTADGRLRAVLWENVPRVLTARGNPFGTILGRLTGSDAPVDNPWYGGRWPRAGVAVGPQGAAAWRVLDAQYFGVAQRRERLFLVAGVGPAAVDPVAVLFERRSLSKAHPRRNQGAQEHAQHLLDDCWPPVAYTLRTRDTGPIPEVEYHDIFPTLRASSGGSTRPFVITPEGIRRMTVGEAECIMGIPPGYTAISWPPPMNAKRIADSDCVDYRLQLEEGVGRPSVSNGAQSGARFSALGNTMAVPILRRLGHALDRQFANGLGAIANAEPSERTYG